MILSFNIEYRTNWGEEVKLAGLSTESTPMYTTDGIYWTAEVELEVPQEGLTIHSSSAKNGTIFHDAFFYPVLLEKSIESMIAGKISRSNYTFIVLPLQKHYYHIPKG